MNMVMVGTVTLIIGLGLGVSVTTVVRTENVEAAMISALRTYDAEKRARDAEEEQQAAARSRAEAEALWNKAMKGWGGSGEIAP